MAGAISASAVLRLDVPDIDVVSCHAISQDGQVLALCPNNEDVVIFRLIGDEFQRTDVLREHTQLVTGLDWSCEGKLVSASEDRTAYVWNFDEDQQRWRCELVELKAPKAATCVAWAPNGRRFAVGLSSKDTAVCYYEPAVECWVALKVGKSKAAVTALSWHPTSEFLATGSTDRKCAVYQVSESAMLPAPPKSPFGDLQVMSFMDAGSWVNFVAFSPRGQFLAFGGQDAAVRFKDLSAGPDSAVQVLRWKSLPFLRGVFLGDKHFVACGFDCIPVLYQNSGESWQVIGSLDIGQSPVAAPSGAFDAARSRFRNSSSGISSGGQKAAEREPTLHSNTITGCGSLPGLRFSTSGLDGQVVVWQLHL